MKIIFLICMLPLTFGKLFPIEEKYPLLVSSCRENIQFNEDENIQLNYSGKTIATGLTMAIPTIHGKFIIKIGLFKKRIICIHNKF